MKRIYSLLIYIVFIQTYSAIATTYTWTGNTSTAWNTTSNWSPSGTPTTGDFVHIYSATYNPQLPGNLTLNGIYMHSGTLNLNGDTLLLNSGTSTFSGGTVTNGLLQLRGTEMTFNSTTFNAPIDAVVDRINLNGCTFNNYCYFETVTNVPGTGSGGAVFNDSVYLYHNYTGSGIWVMNNSTGHRFNGKVTIHNKGTKEITFAGAGINVFNGDIVLINTGAGGILLGNDTLTAGHTISIGSGGFSAGDFNATNFYQDGSAAISLTFTGSALPSITGATFGGNFSITSNVLLFKNCTFSGTASFTATGSGSSSWYGGNKFYGNATFTNNATAGNLRIDADTSNTYYADATFGGSRELRVCYGSDVSSFYGNITTANNTTFNAGTGTLCLAGSGNQTLSFGGSNFVKNLMLNKSGGSAALSTALVVSGTVTFAKGTLTTTSSYLLTINNGGSVSGASDSSFIDGPVKKIGNSAFVFPVGKGNSYRAVEISAPSNTTDAFTGEYFNTGQALGSSSDTTMKFISNCNYWKLTRNSGTSNVNAKLYWNTDYCEMLDSLTLKVANWNGTKWKDLGNGAITGNKDAGQIVNYSSIITYGYLTLGYNHCFLTVNAGSDKTVCSGDSVVLGSSPVANMGMGSYTYVWTPNSGLSSNSEQNPKASPSGNTDYIVTVTDALGCTNSDTASISKIVNNSFIQLARITYKELNAEQKLNYNKFKKLDITDTLYIIQLNNLNETQCNEGRIIIALPFLKCDTAEYWSNVVDYETEKDYKWCGNLIEPFIIGDTIYDSLNYCSSGGMTLISRDGRKYGSFSLEEQSYMIYDITGGLQVLIKQVQFIRPDEGICGEMRSVPDPDPYTQSTDECVSHKINVLVYYTPAASAILDPWVESNKALYQIRSAWYNSGIMDFDIDIVNVLPYNLVENPFRITEDVTTFANDLNVITDRDNYHADICMLLTKGNYGSGYIKGVARMIGPERDSSFAIAEIDYAASEDLYGFAHEFCHLFGARHDVGHPNGDNLDYAHGKDFRGPYNIWRLTYKQYHTIMAYPFATDANVVKHFSNPDVKYHGHYATGSTPYEDNARKIVFNMNRMEDYYTEVTPFHTSIHPYPHTPCSDELNAEVSPGCGTPPYSYQWYKSSNGVSWTAISGEIYPYLSYTINPYSLVPHAWYFKCAITDATAATVYGHTCIPIRPCIVPPRLSANEPDNGSKQPEEFISLKPNPANNMLTLTVYKAENSLASWQILNPLGAKVLEKKNISLPAGENSILINVNSFADGYYIIKIFTDEKIKIVSFIVQH
ncbi:MAG: M12 family metallo-peptidase [Bacteroidia bacterium]